MAATPTRARTEQVGSTAIIRLENPPVNCLDRPLRRDLLTALEAAENSATIENVVLTGIRNFSAGADLKEFDSGESLLEPSLHLTIAGYLDRMTTPVVAAIEGVALGGGLELALACHYRVAAPDATLGLPETTLGFMPGAGGTQRLPRAVGLEKAVNLILSGASVTGTEAAALGLVDEVAGVDLVASAIALARRRAPRRHPRRLRDVPLAEPLAEGFLAFAQRTLARDPKATTGARYALDALTAAVRLPFDEGLAVEFRLFTELLGTEEAKAARYRFLAERQAGQLVERPADAPALQTAAVIGGGTMGRGIALALLSADLPTTIVETSEDRLEAAVLAIDADLDRAVSRGRLSADARVGRRALLSTSTDLSTIGDADIVVEAVFEDLDVKREIFGRLDQIMKAGAVLASNTSSLDLNAIAGATRRPENVVGMHFFSPAQIMPLVEIVQGAHTSTDVLASVIRLVRRLKKTPVVAQVGDGFIGNRIMDQYVRQAMQLLSRGVTPDRIDQALEAWGMSMGPFRVLDLVGNDVPWLARKARRNGAPAEPEWVIADELGERGWFGQKSGQGWYLYEPNAKPVLNPEVASLIASRVRAGGDASGAAASGTPVPESEIVERCILALVNEAAAVLADGIAARPSDIDVIFAKGYGFPPRRGGPLFYADSLGLDRAVRSMRRFAAEDPSDPFWEPHPWLLERADSPAPLTQRSTS